MSVLTAATTIRAASMLTPVEQRSATNAGDCFLAFKADKQLIAYDRGISGEQELVEPGFCADRCH